VRKRPSRPEKGEVLTESWTDLDLVDAREHDHLARLGLVELHAVEPPGSEELGDPEGLRGSLLGEADDGSVSPQTTPLDAADHQPPHEVVVAERYRLEAERPLGIDGGRGRVLEDGVEEGLEVLHGRLVVDPGDARLRRGVDDGEVELGLVGSELHEQIEDLVDHRVGPLLGPVDLVHHQDGAEPVGQRLLEHEAGLGHHALDGVDQQQDAIHHAEHPLHLSPEVGVAGRVHELDPRPLPLDGGGLGEDGDATLPLEVLAVEGALGHGLMGPEHAREAEHAVDQGRLAVVDVGDDGEVAQRGHGGRGA
jgi:hypothetical protein